MTMRLIDADALRIAIDKLEAESDMPEMWHKGIAFAVNRIVHAPTVDPIKHGHWIVNDNHHTCRCSCCENVELIDWALEQAKYCPLCGAKMDEVEEDG